VHWTSRSAAHRGVDDIELERSQWCERFELMSRECAGLEAAIVCVERPRSGTPPASVRLPLRDIRFDEEEDLLTMALGGVGDRAPELRFYIERPRRIRAAESADGQSLMVTERHGVDVQVSLRRRTGAEGVQGLARGRPGCVPGRA